MSPKIAGLPIELVEAWPKMTPRAHRFLVEMAIALAASDPVAGTLAGRGTHSPLMRPHDEAESRVADARRSRLERELYRIGFNARLARALAAADYDLPRLLAADRRELNRIPNVGEKGLAAIDAYRETPSRFPERSERASPFLRQSSIRDSGRSR